MELLRSWGVAYSSAMPHSATYDCPECGWGVGIGQLIAKSMIPYMVGFSTVLRKNNEFPGGLIIECPACFCKFWFHLPQSNIDVLKYLNAWPQ